MEVMQGFGKDPRQAPWHGSAMISGGFSKEEHEDEEDAYVDMTNALCDLTRMCMQAKSVLASQKTFAYDSPAKKASGMDELTERFASTKSKQTLE